MNANENTRTEAPEEMIVLGVASVETHGVLAGDTEIIGNFPMSGIAEE